MTSTTSKKKELIDFLWEWAEGTGVWGRLLVNNIVSHERELSEIERTDIFNYFLQGINLKKGLPELKIKKPAYLPAIKNIELSSLSEVKGVNKLAEGQTLAFEKNLTLVFGENGSGKTGYGRILKALGFSYEADTTIFPNIYKSPKNQSAKIDYKNDGNPSVFNWNGKNRNKDLASISVFNSNCVQISLSESRELIVSPIGFHLFNLISSELNKLSELLSKEINNYPTDLVWTDSLHDETPQREFIEGLSGKTTELEIKKISDFNTEHENTLKDKEKQLKGLNKTLLQKDIKELNNQINELTKNAGKIRGLKNGFTKKEWDEIKNYNEELEKLKGKAQKSINEIAEANGIKFYKTEEFQDFIKSAEEYIKLLGDSKYPEGKIDNCVYCQQPLIDKKAKELLKNYRQILNDNTQQKIKITKKNRKDVIEQINELEHKIVFNQFTFGEDDNSNPVQPPEIKEFNKKIKAFIGLISGDKIDEDLLFDLVYDKYISFLTKKQEALTKSLSGKRSLLNNIEKEEEKLLEAIEELKDRKLLNSKIKAIKKAVENYKLAAILNKNSGVFTTASISRKTTEARNELVASNFNTIFKKELKALNKSHIEIQLDFGTTKGKSKVHQKINSTYNLTDILSEGEQKAIALAEFLTELQLENSTAPVIFDDPVNSLDHNIIDEVAKRLSELSQTRQVVIFSHSILLYYSLIHQSQLSTNKSKIRFKFYNVRTEYDQSGFINDAEDLNQYGYYEKEVNKIINNTDKSRRESDVASDGYGYLRSAIELSVEGSIFKDAVKRYRKSVAFTNFLRVDGKLIDENKNKINDIFERCCKFIKGHSSPTEVLETPTIKGLAADFKQFKDIHTLFRN